MRIDHLRSPIIQKIILSILGMLLIMANGHTAKAICTAKNLATGQVFKSSIGKRSYSQAQKQAKQQALRGCAYASKQYSNYCNITACYKR